MITNTPLAVKANFLDLGIFKPIPEKQPKFIELGNDFFVNPNHVSVLTNTEDPNNTELFNDRLKHLVTIKSATPGQVAKALDIKA